jgi:hypothetical protein
LAKPTTTQQILDILASKGIDTDPESVQKFEEYQAEQDAIHLAKLYRDGFLAEDQDPEIHQGECPIDQPIEEHDAHEAKLIRDGHLDPTNNFDIV